MKKHAMIVVSALFLLPPIPCVASPSSDYSCVIERVETANRTDATYYRSFISKKFTVERKSGIMAGALKNNYVTEPYVVDTGSSENSYKVVATLRRDQGAGAGSNAYLLTVNEYVDAERKPFLFAQNDAAFLGYCTHF